MQTACYPEAKAHPGTGRRNVAFRAASATLAGGRGVCVRDGSTHYAEFEGFVAGRRASSSSPSTFCRVRAETAASERSEGRLRELRTTTRAPGPHDCGAGSSRRWTPATDEEGCGVSGRRSGYGQTGRTHPRVRSIGAWNWRRCSAGRLSRGVEPEYALKAAGHHRIGRAPRRLKAKGIASAPSRSCSPSPLSRRVNCRSCGS